MMALIPRSGRRKMDSLPLTTATDLDTEISLSSQDLIAWAKFLGFIILPSLLFWAFVVYTVYRLVT